MADIVCRVAVTAEEVEGHFAVRRAVFVDEQKLFEESDRDAHDDVAIPLIAVHEASGEVVGAVRCYPEDEGTWYGGRLAVLRAHRKSAVSIGSELCRLAVATMEERGAARFLAWIQLQNVRFFKRLGWHEQGAPVDHCGCEHQVMSAPLYRAATPVRTPRAEVEMGHGTSVAGSAG